MHYQFTRHAKEKCLLLQKYGFLITHDLIQHTIENPVRREEKPDGTYIATSILDDRHVLRVVYRQEDDIIVIITCYPGRRKAYDI